MLSPRQGNYCHMTWAGIVSHPFGVEVLRCDCPVSLSQFAFTLCNHIDRDNQQSQQLDLQAAIGDVAATSRPISALSSTKSQCLQNENGHRSPSAAEGGAISQASCPPAASPIMRPHLVNPQSASVNAFDPCCSSHIGTLNAMLASGASASKHGRVYSFW